MFGKVAVALLIMASPAVAQDPAPAEADAATEAEAPVAYKTKKVCRSVDVVGSSIPKTTCRTKKIPIQAPAGKEATNKAGSTPQTDPQN